jgi:hypothetical protein
LHKSIENWDGKVVRGVAALQTDFEVRAKVFDFRLERS